ncbi:MAG: DegT/DnrJ/EryC1/StrS family aminotransferase [Planctomycetia bacterium]|nr:DegT/DnrJ/EryC1/StrS family aminotransferase [Planctomycetia bacterium]
MIKLFDYLRGYLRHREEIDNAIHCVLESGQLILGPEVRAFEQEFAQYVGASDAVGSASGTDALILALRALEIGQSDEVITVANTAVATVAAIRAVGATPRFVDVSQETLLMDPALLESAITPRTRCLLPVHLFGNPVPMNVVVGIAERHGISVIEDCAQAHGACLSGRHVGTFGTIGCFSFYPTKNLGAFGDGGICVTNSRELAERMQSLRMYGFQGNAVSHREGFNSRLDELQAAILRVKLRYLDSAIQARRQVAKRYCEALQDSELVLPHEIPSAIHAYHLFVVRTRYRSRVVTSFEKAQIAFGIHYPVPIHLMPAYKHLRCSSDGLPVTERAAKEIVSLPMFPELEEAEVDIVIDVLRESIC